ncbi:hypothetical protein IV203_000085 [Nitzschia inconspicua]|uniref:Uncharacterized protein n=1 Tax=Nitzschia inconspicua TaxID=303405 RepID=A0A9K3L491_9STRA|nr:hypothetical protein IV203_000085 [Nitzschia inconspicua]
MGTATTTATTMPPEQYKNTSTNPKNTRTITTTSGTDKFTAALTAANKAGMVAFSSSSSFSFQTIKAQAAAALNVAIIKALKGSDTVISSKPTPPTHSQNQFVDSSTYLSYGRRHPTKWTPQHCQTTKIPYLL